MKENGVAFGMTNMRLFILCATFISTLDDIPYFDIKMRAARPICGKDLCAFSDHSFVADHQYHPVTILIASPAAYDAIPGPGPLSR